MANKYCGSTLIELVLLVVVIAILVLMATPKFIDLQYKAKTASLESIEALMKTAITSVHAKSLIRGNEAANAGAMVEINGHDLSIKYGYPLADYSSTSAQGSWNELIGLDTETYSTQMLADHFVIYIGNIPPTQLNDLCLISYQAVEVFSALAAPTIRLNEC